MLKKDLMESEDLNNILFKELEKYENKKLKKKR